MKFARAFLVAVREFGPRGGWVLSSHIALSMMLAIFPFMLFVLALAGEIAGAVATEDLAEFVVGAWPETIAEPIQLELEAVLNQNNSRLMTVGGLLALIFASNGVDSIRIAMARAYHDRDDRPGWRQRLLCLNFVFVGAVLVILVALQAIAMPIYLEFVNRNVPEFQSRLLTVDYAQLGLTGALLILGVFACHIWLPPVRHSVRTVLPGVVVTLVLWFVAGQAFTWYITGFSRYSAMYAGLAGAMAALIFLYLMSAILIFGAEVNGVLRDSRKPIL